MHAKVWSFDLVPFVIYRKPVKDVAFDIWAHPAHQALTVHGERPICLQGKVILIVLLTRRKRKWHASHQHNGTPTVVQPTVVQPTVIQPTVVQPTQFLPKIDLNTTNPSRYSIWTTPTSTPQGQPTDTFFVYRTKAFSVRRYPFPKQLLFADILFQIVTFSTFTVIKVDFLLPDFPDLKSVIFHFFHACKSNSWPVTFMKKYVRHKKVISGSFFGFRFKSACDVNCDG